MTNYLGVECFLGTLDPGTSVGVISGDVFVNFSLYLSNLPSMLTSTNGLAFPVSI